MTNTVDFLKKLLSTPGPSGFEQAPARVWREEVKKFADDVRADVHGNSIASLNGKGKPRVMFAGHIDEIGIQVTHIDEDGFLYFAGIGGWDSQVLVGQRVLLLAKEGPVHGVVGKKAIHQLKKDELDRVTKVIDLWIDIGAVNRDEAIALLMDKRGLTRSLATRSYDLMIEPGFGFNPDAKLSVEGFNNVLTLRQEIEGGPPPRPEKYLDLSYYDRALKLVK